MFVAFITTPGYHSKPRKDPLKAGLLLQREKIGNKNSSHFLELCLTRLHTQGYFGVGISPQIEIIHFLGVEEEKRLNHICAAIQEKDFYP